MQSSYPLGRYRRQAQELAELKSNSYSLINLAVLNTSRVSGGERESLTWVRRGANIHRSGHTNLFQVWKHDL